MGSRLMGKIPANNNFIMGKGKSPVKNIGMKIITPDEVFKGNYIDKKCPFKGQISIRGRVLRGTVVSAKMERTLIVRRDYLHWIKKYKRFTESSRFRFEQAKRFPRTHAERQQSLGEPGPSSPPSLRSPPKGHPILTRRALS